LNDLKRARVELFRARDLAKSKAVIEDLLGKCYFVGKDYTNAEYWFKNALRFTDRAPAHDGLGHVHQARHEYPEAIEEFKKAALVSAENKTETTNLFKALNDAYVTGGEKGYWNECLNRTNQKEHSEYYWKAVVYRNLGDTNNAILWLKKSLETGEAFKNSVWWHPTDDLLSDPTWDELRNDDQFKKLLEDTGLPRQR
jgi:tetratricopeptide (TPR) repeat protein